MHQTKIGSKIELVLVSHFLDIYHDSRDEYNVQSPRHLVYAKLTLQLLYRSVKYEQELS